MTAVGGGITILLVVVFEFTVEKLLPETDAEFVIPQVLGVLLIVALNVIVVLLPAGKVNPLPTPLTVMVSPAFISVNEFCSGLKSKSLFGKSDCLVATIANASSDTKTSSSSFLPTVTRAFSSPIRAN